VVRKSVAFIGLSVRVRPRLPLFIKTKNKEQNKTMKVKMQVKAIIEVEAQTSDEAFDLIHEITDDSWEIEEIVCLTDGVPNAENSPFNE
jgi:hypothetical protein